MHSIVWWALVGLVAGALAKAFMPGTSKEPQGCIATILLGVAGSIAMGFVMSIVAGENRPGGFVGTIIGAAIGGMLLIWLARKFTK